MESGVSWSGKKTSKGGSDVTGLSANDNVRDIQMDTRNWRVATLMIVVTCLLLCLWMFQLGQVASGRETKTPTVIVDPGSTISQVTPSTIKHDPGNNENLTESNLATVSRQNCGNSVFLGPKTFPNLDYSLLGYNVLRGYPLSIGHDPGFTLPIFAADYSSGLHTADCRYKVPHGLMLIPDVSCEISFSSKTAKTQFQMEKVLSVSAKVGGGGWGVKFSASAGYKSSSSEMRTGESVLIVSTTSCGYYYNELFTSHPPTLHPMFVDWVKKLDIDDKEIYFEFFDTYGTHFAKKVAYGARYSFQYKMKLDAYEKKEQKNVNVEVEASYSGQFSVSGGFGMTSDQKKAAESFSKSVERKLITTGAVPAAKSDANAWAAAVKNNPLPISYDLDSIEKLFTPEFMPGQDKDIIKKIAARIGNFKKDYCPWLMSKGQVNSCTAVKPGIELKHVVMKVPTGKYNKLSTKTYSECLDSCLDDSRCLAMDYCTTCHVTSSFYEICYMYRIGQTPYAIEHSAFNTVIFFEKIRYTFSLVNTMIKGNPRSLEKSERKANQSRCLELCLKDPFCTATTHRSESYWTSTCLLYGADYIQGLTTSTGAVTKFMPWGEKARARALRDLQEQKLNRTAMIFQQAG